MKKLIEAGHIYTALLPNQDTITSINIAKNISKPGDILMQFIDDVHDTSPREQENMNQKVLLPKVKWDVKILESTTIPLAKELIEILIQKSGNLISEDKYGNVQIKLSKKAGKKKSIADKYGNPTCTTMDTALSIIKDSDYDTEKLINILPQSYHKQQKAMHELVGILNEIGEIDAIQLESLLFSSGSNTKTYSINSPFYIIKNNHEI